MATYDSESDVVSDNEDIEVAMSDTEVESPKPKQKRRSRLFPLDRILAVLCCPSLCLAGFTEADLAPLRENYQSLDRTGKKQWLLDYFWSHSQFDNENYTWRFTFVLWSKEVCQTAFRLTLGIASSSFYEVRKLFLDKKKVISQPRTKRTQAFKSKQAM
ncbi:uncharacterized protein LOC134257494, partial [Saccostrea cucullata]|uniref:uncharacterized protein LOC134257494 n=1 Tax=Saccostrea cuccullata TaxID=36930 RepID=UPI002ED12C60